jgi:hypothetical protein
MPEFMTCGKSLARSRGIGIDGNDRSIIETHDSGGTTGEFLVSNGRAAILGNRLDIDVRRLLDTQI